MQYFEWTRRAALTAAGALALWLAGYGLAAAQPAQPDVIRVGIRGGIAVEKRENNPYVNVIAVREADKDQPWVRKLVAIYQTDEVRKFIAENFDGTLIPAF